MIKSLTELFRYRLLLEYLVVLDLKKRYRGSVLGVVWTLLNPLLLMLVMWAVFSRFRKMDEESYALFIFSGLMGWNFFSQSADRSLTAIISKAGLIRRIYLPKLVFPISTVLSNGVTYLFYVIAYLIMILPAGYHLPPSAVLLPLAFLMTLIVSLGAAMLLSALTVFLRDLTHLTSAILRAMFYGTPIFYSADMLGPNAAMFLKINPVYHPVTITRSVLYYGRYPSFEDWSLGFGYALAVLFVGLFVFTRAESKFTYYA